MGTKDSFGFVKIAEYSSLFQFKDIKRGADLANKTPDAS